MAEGRIPGAERGAVVTFELDGEPIEAHAGETVAMALFAAGRTAIRRSAKLGAPRGVFCNMGMCFDCLVYLDGGARVALRSCMLPAEDGMKLRSWAPEDGRQDRTPDDGTRDDGLSEDRAPEDDA